jgi:hypothetical protein
MMSNIYFLINKDGTMKDFVEEFGQYAGKLWENLNKNNQLTKNQLLKKTKLKPYEFYAAVGWLARENKIYKKGEYYKLRETNLNGKIGEDAGKIWNMLQICNEADTFYLTKATGMNKQKIYNALGWLAREGKIKSEKIIPIEPQIRFKLK